MKPIGIIHSAFHDRKQAPRQGFLTEQQSIIEVYDPYWEAASDLQVGDTIQVIYFGSQADRTILRTIPPSGNVEKGVFTTRSPHRPNPLAICIARIVEIKGHSLVVLGLDALDQSPLIDIKGYTKSYHDQLFPL